MNAVLDYDTLEMLGAALRDERVRELDDPLPEKLLALCRELEDDRVAPPSPPFAARADRRD